MCPRAGWQRRNAFSRIASKTGPRSPGDELMTCNTSAVLLSRSALHSSSSRWRSAMMCCGSANLLLGMRLTLADLLGPFSQQDHTANGRSLHVVLGQDDRWRTDE